MTKKQKITIASVAGACALVLAAAIVCIVLFVGGGNSQKTEPASVSTVSSLEETVPAQPDTENTQSEATESAAESETETVSQTEQQQAETTSQQTTQTTPQTTTQTTVPATSQPTTPTTPTQPSTSTSTPAAPAQPSLEDQIAEFDARAPQIIQLAYQILEEDGIEASPEQVDINTNFWIGTSLECGWQEWPVELTWSNERCANDIVEIIKSHEILDGLPINNVQINYLGVNYGNYTDNMPTFKLYFW